MESNARFKLTDCRITRVNERPKVCFLSVMVHAGKYPDYHDIVVFQPPEFALEEGLAVTISGEIQKKKPTNQGEKKWTVEFISRRIELGDDAKAPRPRQSEDTYTASRARTSPQRELAAPEDASDDGIPF